MNKLSIDTGKLIDIIYNNSQSIRGVQDPHIVAFSKFIFSEVDIDSFLDLQKFYKSNSNIDFINFLYCLVIYFLEEKIINDSINFVDVLNDTNFKNKKIKLILNDLYLFVSKPNIKTLMKIKSYDIGEEYINLLIAISLSKTNFNISESFKLYTDLNDYFSLTENSLTPINDNSIENFINEKGLFSIFYFCKYSNCIDGDSYKIFLKSFINQNIFNGFILHQYLIAFYNSDDFIIKFFTTFNRFLSLLPSRFIMSISQFILLFYYLNNDYTSIEKWFDQFNDKIKNNLITKDVQGSFNWIIEDNNFEPVDYRSSQLNSRFYINAIHKLSSYRFLNSNFYINENKGSKINVFGGSQALPFCNLQSDKFYTNVLFQYNNIFSNHDSSYDLSEYKLNNFANNSDINIFIFDYEHFSSINRKKYISSILKNIKNSKIVKNTYLFSTPLPSVSSHRYLDGCEVMDKVNLFNNDLKKMTITSKIKYIDINSFLNKEKDFTSTKDLLCSYFIKPDIIYKIINDNVL